MTTPIIIIFISMIMMMMMTIVVKHKVRYYNHTIELLKEKKKTNFEMMLT